ncbi:MAG: hypothetical protein JO060_03440, partial [Candidatus Eremiobacteraeota bacterium]|nr:hypothetical protein [Candidatus Eremiobacteraeota bacterium]
MSAPLYRVAAVAALLVLMSGPSGAENPPDLPLDPAIQRLVNAVSTQQLRTTDVRLVGFGTRNTFSEGQRGERGVFAARDWIAGQFRAIA